MRIRPTRIHLLFLCFILVSFALQLSCSKDKESFLDAVLEKPEVFIENKEDEFSENPEEVSEEEHGENLETRITSFPTINDAHLQTGKGYNQSIIRLEENFRTSFLMFDLSAIDAINGKIKSASLQFTIDMDDGSGNITVYSSKSNDWSETNLSEDSAPEIDVELGSIIKEYNVGSTEVIELLVENLFLQASTLILVHKEGDDLAFASKEHPDKIGPKLVVTYTVPVGAEEIESVVQEDTTEEDTTEEDTTVDDTLPDTPTNEEPIAIGDASPSSGGAPLSVTFKGDNSSDDTSITSYFWDFKDGSTATNANPAHTFTEVGVYDVELTVKDEQDLSSTDVVTITVTEEANSAPIAKVSATPVTGPAPLQVAFKGSESTDDNSISSYTWDYKDGNTENKADTSHTFTEAGTYEVELIVKDENGLTDKKTITITVTEPENEAPVAVLTADKISGNIPLEVQFIGDKSTDDKAITSYTWDFKDGATATNSNPTHTFTTAGVYQVELTVKDEEGLINKKSITITANAIVNQAPAAIISADKTSGNAPLEVQFTGSNSTDDNAITNYSWNFMDGNSSSESNPIHSFNNPGNYQVELTVQDAAGLDNKAIINVNVTPQDTGNAPPGSYYVTVNGSSNNDGLSEANSWNITHAFAIAKAGDYVYIKAGNYGNVRLQPENSGASGNPVRFIGYRQQPGDIIASNGSTFNYGDVLDANKMPLIKGARINNEGQGTGIYNFHPYIEISNIQVTHYEQGVFSSGDSSVLDNIIVTEVGDFNPSHTYPNNTSNATLNYEGFGFNISGNSSIIKNSFVLNAGAEGFRFSNCQLQKHSFNKVYSNSSVNPTDYYYLLSEGAENNEVSNIYVERIGDLEHFGHGLVLKFSAKSNKIKNSTVKNAWLELSYSQVSNNEFTNCNVLGDARKDGALMIANGAHHNTFIDCNVSNSNGVGFSDWDEDFSRGDVNNAGHHNTFKQCTFDNNRAGITFNVFSQENTDSPAHDNIFDDCTFSNMDNLFLIDRVNNNNLLKNCTITNVSSLKNSFLPTLHSNIPLNAVYQNNTLVNCGFTLD
ncbi:MAG: PKD domain-containing protein [Maribacter sp.]